MLETVRDCGTCLVSPVDLLAGVCRCRLHRHLSRGDRDVSQKCDGCRNALCVGVS